MQDSRHDALCSSRERLILYACGDFLNDYEGIRGQEAYRSELVLMYVVTLAASGRHAGLEMTPLRIRRFALERTSRGDTSWLREAMDRESRAWGARVDLAPHGDLRLRSPAGTS